MTHSDAIAVVRSLAAGLPADDGGVARLLERLSTHSEAEALRSALMEAGARATLDNGKKSEARPFNPPHEARR